MDKEVLVTSGIRAGRDLLNLLEANRFEVAAAAWLRDTELNQWYLHVVSPESGTRGDLAAGLALRAAMRSLPPVPIYLGMPTSVFEVADVRLLAPDAQLACRILDVYHRYPDARDQFVHGGRFDPYDFDPLIYVYSIPAPVPAG